MNVEQDLRSKLAAAIAERDVTRQVLADANQAIDRGQGMVEAAEARLEAAGAAIAASRTQRAQELVHAVEAGGTTVLASPTRKARIEEADAQDDVDASRMALAGLQGRLGDAEDSLRAAENTVTALVDRIIRGESKRVLDEACEAAVRLARCRGVLFFLQRPQAFGQVPHIGRQPGIFEEDWHDAVRLFGHSRASRRAQADAEALKLRDENFAGETAAAIEQHIEFTLNAIHRTDQSWWQSPELAPWTEARQRLRENADTPLPS